MMIKMRINRKAWYKAKKQIKDYKNLLPVHKIKKITKKALREIFNMKKFDVDKTKLIDEIVRKLAWDAEARFVYKFFNLVIQSWRWRIMGYEDFAMKSIQKGWLTDAIYYAKQLHARIPKARIELHTLATEKTTS